MSERLTLSVAEAAALLGVGRNHLYMLINEGQIPHVRFGRLIKIPRSALEEWLDIQSGVATGAR